MAVPKKRVSRTRKYLRNTHWKNDILQEVVRSFSAAKSLGKNLTQFNRGRFSKTRNRRNGFGQPFGFKYEILTEEEELKRSMEKKGYPQEGTEPTSLAPNTSLDQNPENPQ